MFFSTQYTFGGGSVGLVALNTAHAKTSLAFFPALTLAILCNTLVCLAVWMCYGARTTIDRVVTIVPPIAGFAAAGFEHSIANIYFIPLGLFIKAGAPDSFWASIGKTRRRFPESHLGEFRRKPRAGHDRQYHRRRRPGRRGLLVHIPAPAHSLIKHKASSVNKKASMIPAVKAKLLEGKRGLIVGIANDQSIAWGCAKAFRAFGAEIAVTYLNEKAKKFVEPLARELEAPILMPLDTRVPGQMEAVFEAISKEWGQLDFVVHSIAFSTKEALGGRVVDVRQGWLSHDHGRVVLVLHPHGASRRAAHAKGRHALHHDLLRQPDGGEELQHHGRCQGGA